VIPFGSAYVVGALPSGLYAALYLHSHGVSVFVSESKSKDEDERFEQTIAVLDRERIPYEFGNNSSASMMPYEAVVVSPGVPLTAPVMLNAVRQAKFIVGEMEIAAYAGLSVLAVTGSNGKSTTTALLGNIVKQQYPDCVVGGNLGPPVSELMMEHPNAKIGVLEVSCFQLETIREFHPHVAVFSNLVPNHLDRYGTMERYLETKRRLFLNMKSSDFAVLNGDDVSLRQLGSELPCQVQYFGLTRGIHPGIRMESATAVYRDGSVDVELFDQEDVRLPGRHNLANAMSAALASYLYGVSPENIRRGIRAFRGLEHRLEDLGTVAGIRFINDSKATTPESVITAVNAIRDPYVVILGGSSKEVSFDGLAEKLSTDANLVAAVVMGATGPTIARALSKRGLNKVVRAVSLEDAVQKATGLLNGRGTLLLSPACASFDMFRDFEQRGDRFKSIVRGLQESKGL
jgi:UDP-N-acetylmuramoylalanine--D-glutamate ligase